MIDLLIIASCVFLAAAVGVAVEYYKHLARIRKEYEKAKGAFNDVIFSFSRELRRATDSIQAIYYKVEVASSKGGEALKVIKELESRLKALEGKAAELLEDREKLLTRLSDVERQTHDVTEAHKEVLAKLSSLEEKTQRALIFPESGVEAVIPIKREKALAQLTETELAVLEMLTTEGPKTAPEIKERIRLSREHTARLMKKLYEEGYLERDSSKIPFKYSVKKEMESLLRKAKPETA
jgi:chromosome segregation ATPase